MLSCNKVCYYPRRDDAEERDDIAAGAVVLCGADCIEGIDLGAVLRICVPDPEVIVLVERIDELRCAGAD